jgi:hypothetical protein
MNFFNQMKYLPLGVLFMGLIWIFLIGTVMFFLSQSCTLSVNVYHAQGANDSLTEDQRAAAQVSPNIQVPL